jgi:hypothetical protein
MSSLPFQLSCWGRLSGTSIKLIQVHSHHPWRIDNDSDVGLLTGYVLYRLPVELEFMDLDTFPHWFGLHSSLCTTSW